VSSETGNFFQRKQFLIENGHKECLSILLREVMNVNHADPGQKTALAFAASKFIEIKLKELLQDN